VLAGGASGGAGLLPTEVSWLRRVVGRGECAAGVVFRAKVSTIGGNGASTMGVALPAEGTIED
jgi:hypothetical protein